MADAKWGMKRTCQSCACKFYDFNKDPIVCPKCETEFNLEATTRPKRGRKPMTKDQKKEKLKALVDGEGGEEIEGLEDIADVEDETPDADDEVEVVPDIDEEDDEDLTGVVGPLDKDQE